jgi:hypothetical protein
MVIGMSVSKKQAYYHWYRLKDAFHAMFGDDVKPKTGYTSFFKVDCTKAEVLKFMAVAKEHGLTKYEEPHVYKTSGYTKTSMRYVRVQQSESKRANYDTALHIEKISYDGKEDTDKYTIGVGFKNYYPRNKNGKLKAEHEYLMFMW